MSDDNDSLNKNKIEEDDDVLILNNNQIKKSKNSKNKKKSKKVVEPDNKKNKKKPNLSTKSSKNKKNQISNNNDDRLELENILLDAYKKITNFNEDNKMNEKTEEEKELIYSTQMKLCIKYCEKKLRSALNFCQNNPNLTINRSIIDKLSRLIEQNQINLDYIIGNIYMNIMEKDNIFDYSDDNFDINDLIFFINKVIQLKDILKNMKIGIKYNKVLMKFLSQIILRFEFEEEQLNTINIIINDNKEINHKNLFIKTA